MGEAMMVGETIAPSRESQWARVADRGTVWDVIIIGGGATGAGVAMDAAMRGFSVLLLEAHDFGKGTSSRSTKLVHGGVRYLEQFQFQMVRESLRERGRLLANAPDTVHELEFIIPCRRVWERCFYGIGLKLYDFLAIGSQAKRSRQVSRSDLYRRLPGLAKGKFVGGVSYSDGQFDDTRLLMDTILAAVDSHACCLNYANVVSLLRGSDGKVTGVVVRDEETGSSYDVRGRAVINATGPFCDAVRRMDRPEVDPLVAASQGVHLVLPRTFFGSSSAMIVPKTTDGRVLFMIPWLGHLLVGTTDTAIPHATEEPVPFAEEVKFLLDTIEAYCGRRPQPEECLSVFTGIRPLVKGDPNQATKKLSRDHTIEVSPSGLLTITGGKWTTYRHMAEDCVDRIIQEFGFEKRECKTYDHRLSRRDGEALSLPAASLPAWPLGDDSTLSPILTPSDLLRAVRLEMARTVEDLLARRTRALFLNASEAVALAPYAAKLLAHELGRDAIWEADQIERFRKLAENYMPQRFLSPTLPSPVN
ncbi:glycerol-3-phosphate dehydrogenase/oxidase [Pirellulaceae bacterium SH467]